MARSARLEPVAGDCTNRLQRSSSGVEGRNVQLALHHHGRHRLSDGKLAALTAVRNYHIRCADGTTTQAALSDADGRVARVAGTMIKAGEFHTNPQSVPYL